MADFVAHPDHGQDDDRGGDEGGATHLPEFLEIELQPEGKHEQDDAQLGEGVDGGFIPDQWERRRVRANEDAGDDVAQDHGLAELAEQHGDQPGHDHHHRQVLEKGCSMHPGWAAVATQSPPQPEQPHPKSGSGQTDEASFPNHLSRPASRPCFGINASPNRAE